MWFEVLPPMVIILGGILVSPIFGFYFYKFMQNGNPYRRDIRAFPFDEGLLHRDIYLFKKPYVIQGLENIPDEAGPGDNSSGKNKDRCKC